MMQIYFQLARHLMMQVNAAHDSYQLKEMSPI